MYLYFRIQIGVSKYSFISVHKLIQDFINIIRVKIFINNVYYLYIIILIYTNILIYNVPTFCFLFLQNYILL